MPNLELYTLRKSWFKLQAKAFLNRYIMGIVIVFIFLPGVAVGENFNTLLTAVSQPFTQLSQLDSPLLSKLVSLLILVAVFVVWIRAQAHAITGGAFALFQQSLPIGGPLKKSINIKMLLIGNHFLWPFVLASFFYLSGAENQQWLAVVRNVFLILWLLLLQYLSLFANNRKNVIGVLFLAMVFILPIKAPFEVLRLVSVFGLILGFVLFQLHKEQSHTNQINNLNLLSTKTFPDSFYLQILFKSGLTSSLLRLAIVAGLFIGFTLAVDYWVEYYHELTPYYLVLEAMIAYFVSGFYVSFLDQRNTMHAWLVTLPVKHHFWLLRDITAVLILSIVLHMPFYLWAINLSDFSVLVSIFAYHFLLLVLCYPIRVLVTEKQTFITFVVLFIITAITVFKLS